MKVEKRDGFTVVITDERLDICNGPKLREAVKGLAQEPVFRLVLDMAKTRFIDSIGVHTLLSLYDIMKKKNANLKISTPTPRVLETFKKMGLDRLFEIYDSVESAMQSYS